MFNGAWIHKPRVKQQTMIAV